MNCAVYSYPGSPALWAGSFTNQKFEMIFRDFIPPIER